MSNVSRDKLFNRTLENKCPVCDKVFKPEDEIEFVQYNDAKLKVHTEHVRF